MIFYVQLILSFLVGGLFIALQTLIAERVSPLWRGVILTIPSTMALGLFFIGLSKSSQDVTEAATIVPITLGIDYLFVAVFSLMVGFGLWTSLFVSLFVWGLTAVLILQFPPNSFLSSTALGMLLIVLSYLMVRIPTGVQTLKKFPMNARHIIVRALIGGTVVTLALFLSKTLGNVWGGLFSAFPATFSSTFIIYYYLQGKEAIPTVSRALFFPGAIGFIVYAWVASVTFSSFGIWLGTLVSYLAVFIFVCSWTFLARSRK
ncbi:MAG: hypothetical protein AAB383_01235 [Patescibacteria group bacterium]